MEDNYQSRKTVWIMGRKQIEEQLKNAPGIFGPGFPYTEENLGVLVEELEGHPGAYDHKAELFNLGRVSEWIVQSLPEFKERYKGKSTEANSTEANKSIGMPEANAANSDLQQRIASLEKELDGVKESQERLISSLGPTVEGDFYKKIKGKVIELESRIAVTQREKSAALSLLQSERERLERGRRFLLRHLKERRSIDYDSESSFENIVMALEEVISADFTRVRDERESLMRKYTELEADYARAQDELGEDKKVMNGMREVSNWTKVRCDELQEKLRKTEAEREALLKEAELLKRYKNVEETEETAVQH